MYPFCSPLASSQNCFVELSRIAHYRKALLLPSCHNLETVFFANEHVPGTAPCGTPFFFPPLVLVYTFVYTFFVFAFFCARSMSSGSTQVDDADLLDAPPQRPRGDKGVCEKIMGFFGFY